jgi:hypothetical protein
MRAQSASTVRSTTLSGGSCFSRWRALREQLRMVSRNRLPERSRGGFSRPAVVAEVAVAEAEVVAVPEVVARPDSPTGTAAAAPGYCSFPS